MGSKEGLPVGRSFGDGDGVGAFVGMGVVVGVLEPRNFVGLLVGFEGLE